MINNWQVPRNKRRLYPVVDILSLFTLQNLGETWRQDITRQLDFESELERYGIKAVGQRRDRRAGGARTYESWLNNLGLIFTETDTGIVRTTLAGDELLAGQPPVPIITNQLMKLQYPSPYSIRNRVGINERFHIRPFRFLLRLLMDARIDTLSKGEIARFVITEGENESDVCFNHVVDRILDYRHYGDTVLPFDFEELHPSSTTGVRSREATIDYLEDIANTLINYLEYTQLIARNADRRIFILPHQYNTVDRILNDGTALRRFNPNQEYGIENFQRNFGLGPGQNRDNRNFGNQHITDSLYRNRRIRSELLHIAGGTPVSNLTPEIIERIATATGYTEREVELGLDGFRPDTYSLFEATYLNMSIGGRELATEFEIATMNIFEELGFEANHVGASPRHPDVLVESPVNFSGIIDTKAIREYSISNDHRNRMIRNYIPTYQLSHANLEFFMYVADSFGRNIQTQLQSISSESGINGSVISATGMLRLLHKYQVNGIDHHELHRIFTSNSQISITDIDALQV